jgi:hypothetical protein
VKKVQIPIVGLPKDLQGFKIAQISDLHVGPSIGRRYVEKVLLKTNRLNADVVVFTGDIGDGPTSIYAPELAAFKPKSVIKPPQSIQVTFQSQKNPNPILL